ncbi:MAG: SDR family oxidoreductase [Candidatus Rokubacteria bacterium]|nr:SDR family oxidoreductase [Candidatus Rokubacteria bacterium]
MRLKDRVAVVTGAGRGIGEAIALAYAREGAHVVVNDIDPATCAATADLPEAAWDTTMNIGLKGAFLVSQAAARHMIRQRSGCFVNIASVAGVFPYNWAGAYSVVKAGLLMLTKLMALEWAPHGIRANAITPGYIRTPGTEAMYADPDIYEGRRRGVPMGRVGTGEEVAATAVFLASDEARYTTGSIVGADGGQAVGYFLSVPGRRFSGGRID